MDQTSTLADTPTLKRTTGFGQDSYRLTALGRTFDLRSGVSESDAIEDARRILWAIGLDREALEYVQVAVA